MQGSNELTMAQVCERLCVSPGTVRRLVAAGKLNGAKVAAAIVTEDGNAFHVVGEEWRFDEDAVTAYLKTVPAQTQDVRRARATRRAEWHRLKRAEENRQRSQAREALFARACAAYEQLCRDENYIYMQPARDRSHIGRTYVHLCSVRGDLGRYNIATGEMVI